MSACTCTFPHFCDGNGYVTCTSKRTGDCFCFCGCTDDCYGCAECDALSDDTWGGGDFADVSNYDANDGTEGSR